MSNLPDDEQIEKLRQSGKVEEMIKLRNIMRRDKQAICNDPPGDSDKYSIQIQLGDVFVTATDGVYDNLFNREILEIIESYKKERYALKKDQIVGLRGPPCLLSEREEADELARRICKAARDKVDADEGAQRVETPYQRKFKKTYNSIWEVSNNFQSFSDANFAFYTGRERR